MGVDTAIKWVLIVAAVAVLAAVFASGVGYVGDLIGWGDDAVSGFEEEVGTGIGGGFDWSVVDFMKLVIGLFDPTGAREYSWFGGLMVGLPALLLGGLGLRYLFKLVFGGA